MTNLATILIPTYNRPDDLKRLLAFLGNLRNPYPVIVLDGSCESIRVANAHIVAAHKGVTYVDFDENLHLGLRISCGLNEYTSTEYVIICPDDDFVVPKTIEQSIKFMDLNPEFSTLNGLVRCLAYPKKIHRFGFFSLLNELQHPLVLDKPTFLGRYMTLGPAYEAGCPPLFYGLRRTYQARAIFEKMHPTLKYSSMELLSDALTLLWGKATTIPYLLMLRNYSSETTRDEIRDDPVYYITEQDAIYVRNVLKSEINRINPEMPNEQIENDLQQVIALPLEKMNDRVSYSTKTALYQFFKFKKNWFMYLINYLIPGVPQKFDTVLEKDVLIAIKMAFQSKILAQK